MDAPKSKLRNETPFSSSSTSINLLQFECVSMVCSLGGAHMTTFLEGRNTSQIMAEDVNCWKLAAQYIQRQLKEADEMNLLDEEDMDVFGLRPMIDPLILVSCNSCKKPVKVSQYANHAEICKSLSSVVDSTTETEVAGKKKPLRKKKKKLQISISTRVDSVGKPERCATANTVASNSFVDEPKGKEFLNESQARSLKSFDGVNRHQTPIKLNDNHLPTKGMVNVPAPLATKIFYSQRNQRLRSAIRDMYYRSSSTENDHELNNMQFSEIDDHREKDGH